MFTQEELESLKDRLDETEYNKLLNVLNAAIERDKLAFDLTDTIQKIVQNPQAKKKFEELKQVAGIPLDLPKTPLDPVLDEVENLKWKTQVNELRDKIYEKMEEYGLSRDELENIVEFKKKNKIADDFAAIELYSMWRAKSAELEPVKFHNPLKEKPEDYTEDEAYKLAMQDLRRYMR